MNTKQTLTSIKLALMLLIIPMYAQAETFTNNNKQYVVEPNLYAVFSKPSNATNSGKNAVSSKNDNLHADVVGELGGFNIYSIVGSNKSKARASNVNTINAGLPVVKNKRFGNYGIVMGSIAVKFKADATNWRDVIQGISSLVQITVQNNDDRFVAMRPYDGSIANMLVLQNMLENSGDTEWVEIEILEHVRRPL